MPRVNALGGAAVRDKAKQPLRFHQFTTNRAGAYSALVRRAANNSAFHKTIFYNDLVRLKTTHMKPVVWLGRSKEDLKSFPDQVRQIAGTELMAVQCGLAPTHWKSMPGIGLSVKEIRIQYQGQYRIIYVANFGGAVYVLHAFQKKTQQTPKKDMDIAKSRYQQIRRKP